MFFIINRGLIRFSIIYRVFIKSNFSFTSSTTGLTSHVKITNHLGLGVDVNYVTEPNPQYNYSPIVLVNGQKGARPWKGHQWIGFDTSRVIFEITLPKRKKIDSIHLSFLESNGSWIYLPKSIQIQKLNKRTKKTFRSKTINSENVNINIGRRLKKIRFIIDNVEIIPDNYPGAGHTPWTFIDEIEFH